MLRWLTGDDKRTAPTQAFGSISEGLQKLYAEKLLPVETNHLFHKFYSPALTNADFEARPMVLMLGQYSVGKSTFIRHLLGRDYPGLRIGPEPTTDKFVCVLHGSSDQVIPGNALVVDTSLPFTQLSHFGNNFLSRLECARLDCPVLEGITLIDSPGVLSGEKQRLKRGYEFEAVVKWFADRVDIILLLFDISKLEISDEFRRVILAARGNDQKIHIVLNKADKVTTQQLMRVYGALMWSLGKVIDTPEVSRVYVGSFWDEPLECDEQRRLFESEESDLYTMLAQLPKSAAVRKLNDLIKRAQLAKVHAYILDSLKRKMPSMFGKTKEMQKMIAGITDIYQEIATEQGIPLGDFPDPRLMQEKLASMDFAKFERIDRKKMDALDSMLSQDVPLLLKLIPQEMEKEQAASMAQVGGEASPFAVMKVGGATEMSAYTNQWMIPPTVSEYEAEFKAMVSNASGKVTGQQAKAKMVESKLPSNVLHKVWGLADVDKDGLLNLNEWALARHLIKMRLDGQELPQTLPPQMLIEGMAGPPPPAAKPVPSAPPNAEEEVLPTATPSSLSDFDPENAVSAANLSPTPKSLE